MSDKKTWKGDEMRLIEKNVQKKWKDSKNDTTVIKNKKMSYFATFPYPYMNGYLHLGHAYTMSKQDFACRYHRMLGHNVLEPFSFHLTGMPIVAAADKLKEDIKRLKLNPECDMTNTQYEIMRMMEIPEQKIENFTDPKYWGRFFPHVAARTLKKFGIGFDETRSFTTTNENPFYDSFVKWQFTTLFKKQALRFGTRYCVYSTQDKQPCLGHERSLGEDAKPKKYWFVPYELQGFEHNEMKSDAKIFIIATTSRPETLFGVTNLWIADDHDQNQLTKGYQGLTLFSVETKKSTLYWIVREIALIGLCNQYRETDDFYIKSFQNLGMIKNEHIIKLKAIDHNNNNELIPIIAVPNVIDRFKGSGANTSVPSDDPCDHGVIVRRKIQILPRECIAYNLPEYQGNCVATDLAKTMDKQMIQNICSSRSNDCKMIAGKYKGFGLLEAREEMSNELITYYEPDCHAVSRSGHQLIVAKADQWFIDYGDMNWKKNSLNHVEQMTFSDPSVKELLIIAIKWLDQWPCSRTYGLGTYFPDTITKSEFLIDSLSDSTIYMALYTIYHHFEQLKIDPSELTEHVWDYIFLLKDYENEKYKKYKPLRDEFMYWYPVNLRVSAKDLIPNHLAMSIFNHVMIWDNEFKQRLNKYYPEKNNYFGPMRYEIGGYITVQKHNQIEKMSKSKGNFKTLDQIIDIYSADAIRFTFASACGGMDDAFFDQDLCTKMIEKLFKEKEWITQILTHNEDHNNDFESMNNVHSYPEDVFLNEMYQIAKETVKAYDEMNFRSVATKGFHMMQNCRDTYLEMIRDDNYNYTVLENFIKMQLTLIYPITPHFCDHFRDHFVGQYTINHEAILNFPVNEMLRWKHHYVSLIANDITKKVALLSKKNPINKINIYVASEVTDPIELAIRQIIIGQNGQMPENKELIDEVTKINASLTKDNKATGLLIKYYKCIKELISEYGVHMFDRIIENNEEHSALQYYLKYYLRIIKSNNIAIEVIKYTNAMTTNSNIHNVRTCDPVIFCESL